MFSLAVRFIEYLKLIKLKRHAKIASGVRVGLLCRLKNDGDMSNVVIGENTSLHCSIIVQCDGQLHIGHDTTIRYKTEIECAQSVRIGSNVIISNNVIITDNDSHPVSAEDRLKLSASGENSELWSWKYAKKSPVNVEDNVWIGRRAMILKGVTIGRGSVIACGSVVTKSVPPYSICYGNPAVFKPLAERENVL